MDGLGKGIRPRIFSSRGEPVLLRRQEPGPSRTPHPPWAPACAGAGNWLNQKRRASRRDLHSALGRQEWFCALPAAEEQASAALCSTPVRHFGLRSFPAPAHHVTSTRPQSPSAALPLQCACAGRSPGRSGASNAGTMAGPPLKTALTSAAPRRNRRAAPRYCRARCARRDWRPASRRRGRRRSSVRKPAPIRAA